MDPLMMPLILVAFVPKNDPVDHDPLLPTD
jgi:hypothetical protein